MSEQESTESINIIEPDPARPDYEIGELNSQIRENIEQMGWNSLNLVQKKAIPYIMAGENLIVQSKTGSGKTGAFAIPLLQIVEPEHRAPQAIVLVPTRELAVQVSEEFLKLAQGMGIECLAIYGGVGYKSQLDALKAGVHVIVGTPGRILDHLMNNNLKLDSIRDLVLDEADEMLSMGFYPDMKKIARYMPKGVCAYMFSATMGVNVKRLGHEFLNQPKYLNLSPSSHSVAKMDRIYYKVPAMEKDKALLRIIEVENPDSGIIFCNTKKDVSYLFEFLSSRGLPVGMMSGDMNQGAREKVLKKLKAKELNLLVATDIAARGIDVSNLTHVFMYDHPDDPEVYIHRSGRTARAGNRGLAISLVTEIEEISLKTTALQFGIQFIEKKLKDDAEFNEIVHQRAIAYIEREWRDLKKFQKERSKDMVPLVDKICESPEDKEALGVLLYQMYWKHFVSKEE